MSGAVRAKVRRLGRGGGAARPDWVAEEAALEIRIDRKPVAVLMRTPGHDEELARGFLFSEGIIASNADVVSVETIEGLTGEFHGNVVLVELVASKTRPTLDRLFSVNTACGVCGKKTIASLEVRGAKAKSSIKVKRTVLAALPERLRKAQKTFAKTGGVHASGLFTSEGRLVAAREDVGRHNALDKLIGWALAGGKIPLDDRILLVSGRVSYELVQKSVVAGIPVIAAVGAPSSLAIELCEKFGITLVGFVRPGAMNVYAHGERIVG